jgi:hypothetical protein
MPSAPALTSLASRGPPRGATPPHTAASAAGVPSPRRHDRPLHASTRRGSLRAVRRRSPGPSPVAAKAGHTHACQRRSRARPEPGSRAPPPEPPLHRAPSCIQGDTPLRRRFAKRQAPNGSGRLRTFVQVCGSARWFSLFGAVLPSPVGDRYSTVMEAIYAAAGVTHLNALSCRERTLPHATGGLG